MKSPLFLIITFSSIPYLSFAQEIALEKISIKKSLSERPAQGLDYFFQKDIEDKPCFSLEEIIDYSSSVDLRKRSIFGLQQDVSLRGSTFEDTSISLQEIEINDPQTGHFNLEIPLTSADLEQIDIFKNSQRINFIPKRPKSEGFLLKTSFGQHALWEQLLSFNFPLGEVKNRLSCEHKISKGARQDTDFEIYNFSLHSLWEDKNKDKEIEFLFGSTKKDFGADAFYVASRPHEEEHINQRFFSLRAGLKEELFNLNNTFYLRRHGDKYILDRHNPAFYTNYHTTYVYGLKSKLEFYNDLFLAFDIDRETIDSTNLNKRYRLRKGLSFGVKDREIGSFLFNFSGGLDYYEEWEYLENIHLGLGYLLKDSLKLGLSFDRIWRAPSFTELYYSDISYNIGNSNLDIQKSNNFEWGMDYFPNDSFIAGLAFFFRDQSDTIDWVKDVSTDAWQAKNVGDLDVYGLDFHSQVNFKDNILRQISLGYTYLDLNKDNPYNFSKYVFDYNSHKIVSGLAFDLKGVSVNLISNFSKPVDRKRYITFDLKVKKEVSDFTLALEGINIFNEDYQEMRDIEGSARAIKMSIAYSF